MESFWATLKKELIYRSDFRTREEAQRAIFEYIEVFYNRERRHSALGYVSPAEYAARSGNSATPTAPLRFQNGTPAGEDEHDHA
jgi:transposase InsO family protein